MNQPITRSLEDIVDDIVRELGDARGQYLQRLEDDTRAAVLLCIRKWTEFRTHWDQWLSREGQTSMAEHAQKLGDVITTLEQMIRDLPEPLAAYLFMPLRARFSITPAEEVNAAAIADHEFIPAPIRATTPGLRRPEGAARLKGPGTRSR